MHFQLLALAFLLGFSLAGCASSPPPVHVRFSDIGTALASYHGQAPLIVEVQAGDRLPVDLDVRSDDFELAPAHPELVVVAKRHAFVRIDARGVRVSQDGKNFDAKPRRPGTFSVGFGAKTDMPPRLNVAITAPQR
jgi:hypothetical protein